jgi:hypothetical protein
MEEKNLIPAQDFIKYWIVSLITGQAIAKDRKEYEDAIDITSDRIKEELKEAKLKIFTQKDYNFVKKIGLFVYDKIQETKDVVI